jgi:hypothetical protein
MTPTPGQVAYQAFTQRMSRRFWSRWHELETHEQHAWDAAAQAVLAPRLTDQAGKMHLLLAYLLDYATPDDLDALHGWLTEQTARLHQREETP